MEEWTFFKFDDINRIHIWLQTFGNLFADIVN